MSLLIARATLRVSALRCQSNTGKLDPVQQLFLNKVREYEQKKKSTKSGLVDASESQTRSYHDELDRIDRVYSAHKEKLNEFPKFNFTDAKLESPTVSSTDDPSNIKLDPRTIKLQKGPGRMILDKVAANKEVAGRLFDAPEMPIDKFEPPLDLNPDLDRANPTLESAAADEPIEVTHISQEEYEDRLTFNAQEKLPPELWIEARRQTHQRTEWQRKTEQGHKYPDVNKKSDDS